MVTPKPDKPDKIVPDGARPKNGWFYLASWTRSLQETWNIGRQYDVKTFFPCSLFLFHWHTIKGSQCKKNKCHLLRSFWLMRNSGDKWDGSSWMWCGVVIVDIARRQVCPCRLRLALAGTWPWSWQSRVRKPQPWGHNNRPSTRCRATARKRSWFYRLWG